jgi:hypothetical protein
MCVQTALKATAVPAVGWATITGASPSLTATADPTGTSDSAASTTPSFAAAPLADAPEELSEELEQAARAAAPAPAASPARVTWRRLSTVSSMCRPPRRLVHPVRLSTHAPPPRFTSSGGTPVNPAPVACVKGA